MDTYRTSLINLKRPIHCSFFRSDLFISLEIITYLPTKYRYTGYVNTTSLPKYKSFFRKEFLDLKEFNSFVMKVRGDGRSYMITLKNSHYFKETETYLFMHPLYTRGGPYWV